ncbi:MAG: hypothetical protein IPJ65_02210 [Archangiaceae bacterium]|nr:hypothetical protein [Archangiaceae bacterium]
MTSQMQVVQASDQDLPSVMVAPTVGAPTPPPAPAPGRHAPARPGPRPVVPSVLVPASSVRAPEVVAPLPKALEGRHRPDESNTIDRDTRTRTRRSGWWLMLLPLLAILALVAVVGATILRERSAEEADDAARNDSLLRSDSEDRQRKPLDNTLLPDEPAPLPQPNPDEPAADDDLGGLPVKDGAAPPGAAAPAGSKVHKPAPPRKRN